MKNAKMNVIRFNYNDVIATSGLMMSGLGDNDSTNNKFNGEALSNYANDVFLANLGGDWTTILGNELIDVDSEASAFNGPYKYYASDAQMPTYIVANKTAAEYAASVDAATGARVYIHQ